MSLFSEIRNAEIIESYCFVVVVLSCCNSPSTVYASQNMLIPLIVLCGRRIDSLYRQGNRPKQVKLLGQDHIISYIIEKIRTYQFSGIKGYIKHCMHSC